MRIFLVYTLLTICLSVRSQTRFNGNFEQLDRGGNPRGWDLTFNGYNTLKVRLDSLVKRQGKYAISINSDNDKSGSAAISFKIPERFKGKLVSLVGSIKTEGVTDGFAGLWLRTDGRNGQVLAFDNMEKQQLKGTNDWHEYLVEIPYQEESVESLNVGALLMGKGKVWIDSLRLYIDQTPVEKLKARPVTVYAASNDTSFRGGSGIKSIAINKKNIEYLNLLGQLWGFLKYHHPEVSKGQINWDAELFRIIPSIVNLQTAQEVSGVFEKWVDRLGVPDSCSSCAQILLKSDIAMQPAYGDLFKNEVFSKSLNSKLKYILANRNVGFNYYVGINKSYGDAGNPQFDNENPYPDIKFPDAGYQLLSLFRYWNMIQYFFPSRELITEGWKDVLLQYIPEVIQVKDKVEYTQIIVKLISGIHDAHATIHSTTYEGIKGKYRLPLKTLFIGNKLIVNGYYDNSLKNKVIKGDRITHINGVAVKSLIKKYYPITSASNDEGKLMNMISLYLFRNNSPDFVVNVERNGKRLAIDGMGVEETTINFYEMDSDPIGSGYSLLAGNIAYIHPKKFNLDWKTIKSELDSTRGIIIDMRTYPESRKTYELVNYIKPDPSPFVKYTSVKSSYPGQFYFSAPFVIGTKNHDPYRGKVVVIVNSKTLSQAEATTMAFQSSNNVIVIGSTTAGADGSVSKISLPGGIDTGMSGIGMYYPDGLNTQRSGVKIDYRISPTINGIRDGKDELLEKAKQLITGSK